MKEIAVIIPLHEITDENLNTYYTKALKSVDASADKAEVSINTYVVVPKDISEETVGKLTGTDAKTKVNVLYNDGKTDFCSQVNYAVDNIKEDFFSILEFDDTYTDIWFRCVEKYYKGREDVSVFMPLVIERNKDSMSLSNEILLATSFSDVQSYMDAKSLELYKNFHLTGSVINREDFINAGKFKPSIEVAFIYEFLLRLINSEYKAYVVPKQGYIHEYGRKGSLTDYNLSKYTEDEIKKWYDVALREYTSKNEKKRGISKSTKEKLK